MSAVVRDVIGAHRASGRSFTAAGVSSFVLDQGQGAAVVYLHGIPASSFLYRKVVPELAERNLRGIAFDYPGTGLAGRPSDFDYSWSGLACWTSSAIDALAIDRCHLVVHDIGGPIGRAFLKIMRGFELTPESRSPTIRDLPRVPLIQRR
jgi:pimeloyl-ACP methyl ester carboxylesterase